MHRFYRLILSTTMAALFGQYAVVREWGLCSSTPTLRKLGHHKEDWYASFADALKAAEKLKVQKTKKGYQLKLNV